MEFLNFYNNYHLSNYWGVGLSQISMISCFFWRGGWSSSISLLDSNMLSEKHTAGNPKIDDLSSDQNPGMTFRYTDWFIGILILVYCSLHIIG